MALDPAEAAQDIGSYVHAPAAAMSKQLMMWPTLDMRAGKLADILESVRRFRDDTKAWTDGRFLEQLRRTFRITDGQPNILVVDAEMLRRHSVCLRLQDLAAIIDAQPPDQEPTLEVQRAIAERNQIIEREAAGPTVIMGLGHFHAMKNVIEMLHPVGGLTVFARAIGYDVSNLVRLEGNARGYYPQNIEFFRQLLASGMLEFHRVARQRMRDWWHAPYALTIDIDNVRFLGAPDSAGNYPEYMLWTKLMQEQGETCATIGWWFGFLLDKVMPLMMLYDAVRDTHRLEPAQARALEVAALKILLRFWITQNHHTYYAIVMEYIIMLECRSDRWVEILDRNIGVRLTGEFKIPGDMAIEMDGNRRTKQVKPAATSAAEVIQAANTCEMRSTEVDAFAKQCGIKPADDDVRPTPKRARDFQQNVDRMRAVWRVELVGEVEVWLPHDRAYRVFERTKAQKASTMKISPAEERAIGEQRVDEYARFKLGAQQVFDRAVVVRPTLTKPKFPKVKLYEASAVSQTVKQLYGKTVRLQTALAEQAGLERGDAGGPFALTEYNSAGATWEARFDKRPSMDKAWYRKCLMGVFTGICSATAEGGALRAPDGTPVIEMLVDFLGVRVMKSGVMGAAPRVTNRVTFPDCPGGVVLEVIVLDGMVLMNKLGALPEDLETGGDLVLFVLQRAVDLHKLGFRIVEVHFDVQAPITKQVTEEQRDSTAAAGGGTVAGEGIGHSVTLQGKLPPRSEVQKIFKDRAGGRQSFLRAVAEATRARNWLADRLQLPEGFQLIVRGASRTVCGEGITIHHDGNRVHCSGLVAIPHPEADTSIIAAGLMHARGLVCHPDGLRKRKVLLQTIDHDSMMACAGLVRAMERLGGGERGGGACGAREHVPGADVHLRGQCHRHQIQNREPVGGGLADHGAVTLQRPAHRRHHAPARVLGAHDAGARGAT
jgi:hypothetical protein